MDANKFCLGLIVAFAARTMLNTLSSYTLIECLPMPRTTCQLLPVGPVVPEESSENV